MPQPNARRPDAHRPQARTPAARQAAPAGKSAKDLKAEKQAKAAAAKAAKEAKAAEAAEHPPTKKKLTLWQRFGAGSLTISVLFHVILLAVGAFWVLRVIHPPEKVVDFMPSGGGGGSPEAAKPTKQPLNRIMKPDLARIVAMDAPARIVLPESSDLSALAAVESLGGSLSGGLGGSGSGGGKGSGTGDGFGDGRGSGAGNGSGLRNPFGLIDADSNALVGQFYDLKQKKDGTPTNYGENEALGVITDFVTKGGWNRKILEDYYKAPNTLYQTQFYIPIMSAALAPEAFGCADKVKPVNWVALYRGYITPPKSGKYRFVGRADNVMVVRFNRKIVLDGGDYSAGVSKPIWDPTSISVLRGTSGNKDLEREMRRGGFDIPVKSYDYPTTGQYNERGGVMVGKDITVRAGQRYPVEILLSELGGLFGASLLIEEQGAEYKKDSNGSPILPLFRLDPGLPTSPKENRGSPPYDPEGPVWKVVPGEFIESI
ncbi:hypothetical protein OJ996_11150 [Luteolibacter sp. GHJ8]|uniref:PA14 domain-containing protein n=1 Tax=Luteolibacter rhizosphaerae TaxID=2989719 RepID=A0ABT3G2Q6_9BACT|nr:hypothetical protein [Luteolibacter rhizosphaerae]MCW1914136.1 hypothetical protein [Luteolibacter rhizosphaerae]